VQLEAVKERGQAIRLIQNQSEKMQLAAVQQSRYAIKYIKNPCQVIIELIKIYDIIS